MPISVVKNENHIQANKTHLSANPKETLFFWFCHFIKKKPSTSYVLSTNKTTMTKYIGTVLVGHKHEHCVQMKCVSVCCRTHSPTLWTWSCKSNGMVIFFCFVRQRGGWTPACVDYYYDGVRSKTNRIILVAWDCSRKATQLTSLSSVEKYLNYNFDINMYIYF